MTLVARPLFDHGSTRPGSVASDFSEQILMRATEADVAALWDGATTLAGLAQKWNGHGREKNQIKAAQMFCEIELGQRLGPNPGQGSRSDLIENLSHAISDIPQPRVVEFRRYLGHRELLISAVREGKRSSFSPSPGVDTPRLGSASSSWWRRNDTPGTTRRARLGCGGCEESRRSVWPRHTFGKLSRFRELRHLRR